MELARVCGHDDDHDYDAKQEEDMRAHHVPIGSSIGVVHGPHIRDEVLEHVAGPTDRDV
jgi:hypothetical protein